MKMKKLDLEKVDLSELSQALEDHSGSASWWLDPESGELHMLGDSMWDGEDIGPDFEPPARFRRVEALDSREMYADLEDFTAAVRDPRARGLRDEKLVDDDAAERALLARPDPDLPPIAGPFDARAIARAVADDLRGLYGQRLRKVVLFGSWARGDAHPESDIDLLVVLDDVKDRMAEHRAMNDILYRHSLDNDTVVTALPVSSEDFERPRWPALIRARIEGQPIS